MTSFCNFLWDLFDPWSRSPVGVDDAGLEVSGYVPESEVVLAGGAGHGAVLVVLGAPHVVNHVGGEGVDLRGKKQLKGSTKGN